MWTRIVPPCIRLARLSNDIAVRGVTALNTAIESAFGGPRGYLLPYKSGRTTKLNGDLQGYARFPFVVSWLQRHRCVVLQSGKGSESSSRNEL